MENLQIQDDAVQDALARSRLEDLGGLGKKRDASLRSPP